MWIGFKSPFNLVKFLERDIYLEEKLEEFESDFEKDEVVEVWKWNKYTIGYIFRIFFITSLVIFFYF
jgi:hypothetical protein